MHLRPIWKAVVVCTRWSLGIAAALLVMANSGASMAMVGSGAAPAKAQKTCGSLVHSTGGSVVVSPSGADDSVNIRCAFDLAKASHANVELAIGNFTAAQVFVYDFRGRLRGQGTTKTLVRNPSTPIVCTPVDFHFALPGPSNPWPSLFVFVSGHVTVSNLAVHISGDPATTGWSVFGGPIYTGVAHAFAFEGPESDAVIDNVDISGEPSITDVSGFNIGFAVMYQNLTAPNSPPVSGSYRVTDSTFDTVTAPIAFGNVKTASVVVSGNTVTNAVIGGYITDVDESLVEWSHNSISAAAATIDVFDWPGLGQVSGISRSVLLIHGNTFGGTGLVLESDIYTDTQTLIAENKFGEEVNPELFLGPAINNVHAVGITRYIDEGTNNHIKL